MRNILFTTFHAQFSKNSMFENVEDILKILSLWKYMSVYNGILIIMTIIHGLFKIFRNSNCKTHAVSILSLIHVPFIYQYNVSHMSNFFYH